MVSAHATALLFGRRSLGGFEVQELVWRFSLKIIVYVHQAW